MVSLVSAQSGESRDELTDAVGGVPEMNASPPSPKAENRILHLA